MLGKTWKDIRKGFGRVGPACSWDEGYCGLKPIDRGGEQDIQPKGSFYH
jgi:hypothetical protein